MGNFWINYYKIIRKYTWGKGKPRRGLMRSMDGTCHASHKLKNILQSVVRHAENATLRCCLPLPQMYSRLYRLMLHTAVTLHSNLFHLITSARTALVTRRSYIMALHYMSVPTLTRHNFSAYVPSPTHICTIFFLKTLLHLGTLAAPAWRFFDGCLIQNSIWTQFE